MLSNVRMRSCRGASQGPWALLHSLFCEVTPPHSPASASVVPRTGDMEVLDDLAGEAADCAQKNPWLTYGYPMHRMREWGSHHKLFDLLDERSLAPSEVRDFLMLLLGGAELPQPELELSAFVAEVARRQKDLEQPYNPLRKRRTLWVDEKRLKYAVNTRVRGCAIS
mmetsp:Transcript_22478/g.60803  ORF Transcript_22478/g.60803 Transcript_22478/m.60803 type:complete len:167 (+) Transcript_22478:745-1245(+)